MFESSMKTIGTKNTPKKSADPSLVQIYSILCSRAAVRVHMVTPTTNG